MKKSLDDYDHNQARNLVHQLERPDKVREGNLFTELVLLAGLQAHLPQLHFPGQDALAAYPQLQEHSLVQQEQLWQVGKAPHPNPPLPILQALLPAHPKIKISAAAFK